MRTESSKRCSRCQTFLPLEAFALRRASPDGRQTYCRTCNSEWARARRPRKLRDAPAVEAGEKWCRSCETTKALSDFATNKSAKDGLQAQCRACAAAAYRVRRVAAGFVVRPAEVPSGFKYCRSCDTVKPLAQWSRNATASDRRQTRCKDCASAAGRRGHLSRKYGMTQEDVAEMLAAQGGLCIICLAAPAVHVDHDHTTGEVRGLLCFPCNAGLGQLGDSPQTLRRAADYLEGRKISLERPHPGVVLFTYPAPPPPPPRWPTTGVSSRPVLDVRALRAAARTG